jgi:hypothetical protein
MYPTAETEVHIEIRRRTGTLQYRNSIHLDLVLKIHPVTNYQPQPLESPDRLS